ncbi:MAG: hypothetical protein MJ237_03840 [bacterium]|nr:hypothetical protein [bacterium]
MNILIIGEPYENLLNTISKSKLLDKLYTTRKTEGYPNIEYLSFEEFISKAKALCIDVAINTDKDFVKCGFAENCKKFGINLFSVNQKWLNLETFRIATKHLLSYYSINIPQTIKVPVDFPVVFKSNDEKICDIVYSMQELIEKTRVTGEEKTYIEEYLDGDIFDFLYLWDGKNILQINKYEQLTEVQADRLDIFKTKLHFMLSDENADFVGFFTVRLIWAKNDWYVKEFIMGLDEKSAINNITTDFLYILNSAVYQKLNEL